MSQRISNRWKSAACLFSILGMLAARPAAAQWHDDAWTGGTLAITQILFAAVHSITITNWPSPTNPVATNLTFLTNIEATNTAGTVSGSITFRTDAWATNGVPVVSTQLYSWAAQARVATNLILWNRQICEWDAWAAIREREIISGRTNASAAFFLNSWANLEAAKDRIADLADPGPTGGGEWLLPAGTGGATNWNAYWSTNTSANANNVGNWPLMLRKFTDLPMLGFPTNWALWSPRHIVWSASDYASIVTSTVWISTTPGITITSDVMDSCGNVHTNLALTNGQVLTFFCTNYTTNAGGYIVAGVAQGHTSFDYCWPSVRTMLTNNFRWTLEAMETSGGSESRSIAGYSTPLCNQPTTPHPSHSGDAVVNADAAWSAQHNITNYVPCGSTVNTNIVGIWSSNSFGGAAFIAGVSVASFTHGTNNLDQSTGIAARQRAYRIYTAATNAGIEADLYCKRAELAVSLISPPVSNYTYEAAPGVALATNFQQITTITHLGGTNAWHMGDVTAQPAWPAITDGSQSGLRGWALPATIMAVIRWDSTTNGLRFK